MSNKPDFPDLGHQHNHPAVSDEMIKWAFDGTNFGPIDGDLEQQRLFLAKGCTKTLAGYHNGHTIFRIMVVLDLVEDKKKPSLTKRGGRFVFETTSPFLGSG